MSTVIHPVEVDHVTKTFRRHHDKATSLKQFIAGGRRRSYDEFVALDDVSFNVRRGEVFGVVGHNGSGKSTMLKCMAGILHPNKGEVRVHERMSALLELGAGFHPELSGRENVQRVAIRIRGLDRAGCSRAAALRPVFDHELMAGRLGDGVRIEARDHVAHATGRQTDDDLHRTAGIVLSKSKAGEETEGCEREHSSARSCHGHR